MAAQKVLIMGISGTGKTTSIRNCDPAITAIVNPVGKALPFRGKFDTLNDEIDNEKIISWVEKEVREGKKIIVIDDFQYILSVPYMNRIKEGGWDKWNDFGDNYFRVIDMVKDLPDDVTVYYLTHCETLDNGITTIKLIGKMLREKISIEGLFTIVLMTGVSEGKYYFFTHNNGKNTVKSPIGMFDADAIQNDLAYVDAKVRNYYGMAGAKSDEEMKQEDQAAAVTEEEIKPSGHRRNRQPAPEPEAPAVSDRDFFAKTPHGTVFAVFKGEKLPKEEYTEITEEEYKAQTGADPEKGEVPFDEVDRHPDMAVQPDDLPMNPPEEPRHRRRRTRKEA